MGVTTAGDESFVRDVVVSDARGIVSVHEDGTVVFANRAAERLLGADAEDLLGRRFDKLARSDSGSEAALAAVRNAVGADPTRGAPPSVDLRLVRSDGRDVPVAAAVESTDYEGDQYVTLTLRERSGGARRRSGAAGGGRRAASTGGDAEPGRGSDRRPVRENLPTERVLDAIPDLVYTLDGDGNATYLNGRVSEVTGYPAAELDAMCLLDLIPPADREAVRTSVESVLRDGEARTVASALVTSGGEEIPYEFTAAPLTDEDGAVVGLVGTGRDVSDRNARERELGRYETMVEAVGEGVGVYAMDEDLRLRTVNSGAVELTGYAREELEGMHLRELLAGEADGVDETEYRALLSDEATVVDDVESARRARTRLRESDREVTTVESPIRTADGETLPLEIRFSELPPDGAFRGTAGFLIDVSDRNERKRLIRRRSAAMEAAIDGIAVLDEDGRYVYANRAHARLFGYDDPDDLTGESLFRRFPEAGVKRMRWDVLPTVWNEGHWRGKIVGRRTDGSTFPQEVSLTQLDDGGLVWVVRDASERIEQERRLERLNESSRELTAAETTDAIARVGLESVTRIFGFDVVCVRLFDSAANTLEPVAMTDEAEALVDERLAFDLEATLAGRAYRQGEAVVNEPDGVGPGAGDRDHASLHLPLGDRGTLTIVDGAESFDDADVHLAKVLAATIRAHLDRAEREQTIRENAETLRRQRDQLDTLNRLNGLVQEIIRELIEAGTREGIEERVCEQLASSELYRSAWIGAVDVAGERITPRTAAGIDGSRLEPVDPVAASQLGNRALERAIDREEIAVSRRYLTDGDAGAPESERAEATAAIPLQHGGRIYGVLVVNTADEETFDEMIRAGLAVLGDTIGFAISAIENKELLLSNEIVELEFAVTDPNCFAVRLSDKLDCRCHMKRAVLTSDENYLSYVHVAGASAEAALEAAAEFETVTASRVIREHEDGCLLEVSRTRSGAVVMMEFGATTETATAERGEGRLVVEAPRTVDVREIVDAYREYNPESELVAKREVNRPVRTAEELRQAVEERLTERQKSVIETAYAAGYYDWPRSSTAEEIADSMGVSSATLHQHLRRAQKELLAVFLEDSDGADGPKSASTDL